MSWRPCFRLYTSVESVVVLIGISWHVAEIKNYVAYLIVSGNVNRGVNCIPFFLSDVSLLSQQL